jgi:hypothetical protein
MDSPRSCFTTLRPGTRLGIALMLLASASAQCAAQTVEKVADLDFATAERRRRRRLSNPSPAPFQVGTNLWFTTDKGGTFDAGTVSRFDLITGEVVQVASFDNDTGKGSESADSS